MQPLWEIVSYVWPKTCEIKPYHSDVSFLCMPHALGEDTWNCSFHTSFLVPTHICHEWSLSQHLTWVLVLFGGFQPLCVCPISTAVWNQGDRQRVKHPHHPSLFFFFSIFFPKWLLCLCAYTNSKCPSVILQPIWCVRHSYANDGTVLYFFTDKLERLLQRAKHEDKQLLFQKW